jgi:hypothetical protein
LGFAVAAVAGHGIVLIPHDSNEFGATPQPSTHGFRLIGCTESLH